MAGDVAVRVGGGELGGEAAFGVGAEGGGGVGGGCVVGLGGLGWWGGGRCVHFRWDGGRDVVLRR